MNSCTQYLLNLLVKKDYSKAELISKANQKEFDGSDTQEAINYLLSKKFINDSRLAENIYHHYKGKKGINWIKQKMQLRKLDNSTITDFINKLPHENVDPDKNIKELLARKYNILNWQEIDIKTKAKILRFLSSRGFLNVYGILNKWQEGN